MGGPLSSVVAGPTSLARVSSAKSEGILARPCVEAGIETISIGLRLPFFPRAFRWCERRKNKKRTPHFRIFEFQSIVGL